MEDNYQTMFPDNRDQGKTVLRKSQLVMLRILKIVDHICRKYNIKYWLDSGTLLGAVRHEGFIPWDDDLDIVMYRKDYERFIEVAKKELPDDLFLQNNDTDINYGFPWVKIRDRNSMIIEYKPGKYHRGIFIDIFPMDDFSGDYSSFLKYKKVYRMLHRLLVLIKEPFQPIKNIRILARSGLKLLLSIVLFPFAVMSKKSLNNFLKSIRSKIMSRFSKNGSENLVYGLDVMFWDHIISKSEVYPLKELKFEDGYFFVPNNYDAYLKKLFGDYMKLPPEKDRIPHNLGLKPIITEAEKEELNRDFK